MPLGIVLLLLITLCLSKFLLKAKELEMILGTSPTVSDLISPQFVSGMAEKKWVSTGVFPKRCAPFATSEIITWASLIPSTAFASELRMHFEVSKAPRD